MTPTVRLAFTLIELLVVVTIIVVLLALLMPSLDEAVYQAELATCAARMDAAATGVVQYAMEARRSYPHREGPGGLIQWEPGLLANRFHDDRPAIFSAAGAELWLDPFASRINLATTVPDNFILAHNKLWFGWAYVNENAPGMDRMGDRFTFAGVGYNLLISDTDDLTAGYETSSHPDRADRLAKRPGFQDVVNPWPGWNTHGAFATWTNWSNQNNGLTPRGELDLNYAYDDGSVRRLNGVLHSVKFPEEERVIRVPSHSLGTSAHTVTGGTQIPRQ